MLASNQNESLYYGEFFFKGTLYPEYSTLTSFGFSLIVEDPRSLSSSRTKMYDAQNVTWDDKMKVSF